MHKNLANEIKILNAFGCDYRLSNVLNMIGNVVVEVHFAKNHRNAFKLARFIFCTSHFNL